MNSTILSFTHVNYMVKPSGTEKYVRDLSLIYKKNGINHLNLFSFFNNSKKKMLGINLNNQFLGIYKYEKMLIVIQYFVSKYKLNVNCIHLQHLLNHDVSVIKEIIKNMDIPVYLFVHDYYIICNNPKLIDSNNYFCQISSPKIEKCAQCANCNNGITHYKIMNDFLKDINKNLKSVIVPSEFVKKAVINIYPFFENKIIVRNHLVMSENKYDRNKNQKIRIAFVGNQSEAKGFGIWKKLVSLLKDNQRFELYYFGTGKECLENVNNIYVSTAESGSDAMIKAICSKNIDIALLWTNWPETYNYVYYELSNNDVYILTNNISGNIHDEVLKNQNGMIFESVDDLYRYVQSSEIERVLTNYRSKPDRFYPAKVEINKDLNSIFSTEKGYSFFGKGKIFQKKIASILYFYKYKKYYINMEEV